MLRSWQVFWAEPGGPSGCTPISAATVEEAYKAVKAVHPGATVSAIDAAQLDAKWMPSLMVDWLGDWEEESTT